MVSPRNDELCIRDLFEKKIEGFDHKFQPLIGSPFPESENSMWSSASSKIRQLRPARQNAVCPQMNVISPILIIQNLAISRHEYGHRIRQ